MDNAVTISTKKIAIFLAGLYGGGAERVMLNLAAGFAASGFATDLVLAQAEGPYLKDVPQSVRIVALNPKHRSAHRSLTSLPAFVRYIRLERPDVMLSCLNFANVIALWAKNLARVPLQFGICEQNTFSRWRTFLPFYYRWPLQMLMQSAYPKADAIIAVSHGVADDLATVLRLPRERITVIYNPIITPEMQIKKCAPLEDPWFKENQPPVVVAIGRLTRQKGFDILLQAFAQVRKHRPARLLILGEGDDRPMLTDLIKDLGLETDVRLPGFVANPLQYLAKASLFVLSSRWEGLPTVLVEALYCGTPLIATDCPSGPREILRDGQFGQLVPIEDSVSLSQAMLSALDGKIAVAPNTSWKEYELTTIIRQYEKTLFGM